MGWSATTFPKRTKSIDAVCELTGLDPASIVISRSVPGGVALAVTDDNGNVFGAIALVSRDAVPGGTYIGVKFISEDMGPNESAPPKVLDALSPVEDIIENPNMRKYATAWRERSRAEAERKALLVPGTAVTVSESEFWSDPRISGATGRIDRKVRGGTAVIRTAFGLFRLPVNALTPTPTS